ncbi:MAG: hypothetical protein AAF702_40015 [Chloroflexota bacterium]
MPEQMSDPIDPQREQTPLIVYQIRVQGHLSLQWAEWFEEVTITLEETGDTLLTGSAVDQARLYSWLRKVRDLGMPLLSVIRVESEQREHSSINHSS